MLFCDNTRVIRYRLLFHVERRGGSDSPADIPRNISYLYSIFGGRIVWDGNSITSEQIRNLIISTETCNTNRKLPFTLLKAPTHHLFLNPFL